MDQKWILALGILVFYQKVTCGECTVKTPSVGEEVDIKCNPRNKGSMVIWFRVLDKTGMQFIASFTNNGILKTPRPLPSTFKSKMESNILTLIRFTDEDSGVYSCASLIGGNELQFGEITRLNPNKAPVQKPAVVTTEPNQVIQTTTACTCTRPRDGNPSMSCPLIILAPLAGGCGLLLLVLIVTTLYCNKIRTRRCPHHHKRKPRMMEPGKQMRPNSHI
ncbi:T-cell surface glycoprotein CD8 alpha chain [Sphaeramia orbicularis]|uniref:T-cell surface glycoprotein CD8 alpha chain n=1 Tax=Sphaeramia orbicularis TaxID=375764 RepID=A0A672Y637_9TELE|nr:T-cell surface glycoprotein CD8 alpha chain-like [Sphaeramia orbicularis]